MPVEDKGKRTIEHLVPLSKGGSNNTENKAICCGSCNYWRGNKDYHEWEEEIHKLVNNNMIFKAKRYKYHVEKMRVMLRNIYKWKHYVIRNANRVYADPTHKRSMILK
jgi:uncharacterized protein involved in tolerance to divalent cations